MPEDEIVNPWSIRRWIREYLMQYFPTDGTQIMWDSPWFTHLTGLKKDDPKDPKHSLTTMWANGNRHTSCVDFLCHVNAILRVAGGLPQGPFNALDISLNNPKAWHTYPDAGLKPRTGDLFRAAGQHVGVVLDVDGDACSTVEGGQAIVGSFDSVKRNASRPMGSVMAGWLDIEAYLPKWDWKKSPASIPHPK